MSWSARSERFRSWIGDWRKSSPETALPTTTNRAANEPTTIIRTVRSKSSTDLSQAGSVLGTPAYMAPEQANGDIEAISERTDVFGLGSILCEILTGEPAYTGDSSREILRKAGLGETKEALARLDVCVADGDLLALARAASRPMPPADPATRAF